MNPLWGGGNIIDKIKCKNRIGYDINEYLIELLKYTRDNPTIDIAPNECSVEHYKDVRESYKSNDGRYSKEYIGLIGFCASFGCKWWGSYGRHSKGESIYMEGVVNLRKQAATLKNIQFGTKNYMDINPSNYKNCLFYLDPPYKGTTPYKVPKMDYNHFYDWCRELAKNNYVFISEYDMPNDFECIWTKETKCMIKSNRTTGDKKVEKLFIIGGKL